MDRVPEKAFIAGCNGQGEQTQSQGRPGRKQLTTTITTIVQATQACGLEALPDFSAVALSQCVAAEWSAQGLLSHVVVRLCRTMPHTILALEEGLRP